MSDQVALAGNSPRSADSRWSARGCFDCGTAQLVPAAGRANLHACAACAAPLERAAWRSISAAGALAAASALTLLPATVLPLMRTALLGASREASLVTSIAELLSEGWPEIAAVVALCTIVFPLARFTLLAAVCIALQRGERSRWLGSAFRHAQALQPWAMPDVLLVGFLVAWLRLLATLPVDVGGGGLCLAATGILALLTRAATNPAQIWRAILPDPPVPPPGDVLVCATCARLAPATMLGVPCARCGAVLERRKPFAFVRAAALIIAGALLYFPANLYPIATLPIGAKSMRYTVLEGVIDLYQARLYGLAMVVFTASFVIPLLKLGAMAWCLSSILRRSRRHLLLKRRAVHFVEEIGRWSMVDPFLIACFVPVTSYNGIIYGRAELGLPFFTGVVVLTMIAARAFDPRLLLDAAKRAAT